MPEKTLIRDGRGIRLPSTESRLLARINRGFADAWWERYHELIRRRQESLLSVLEHRELIQLTDEIEKQEAKRLQALVKLAKLRKQPLGILMKDLGLSGETDA